MKLLPWLCVVWFLVGCATTVTGPSAVLETAAKDALLPNASAKTLALAGFEALLLGSDAAKAQKLLDGAVAKDPTEP